MNQAVTDVLTRAPALPSSFTSRVTAFAQTYQRRIELVLAVALYFGFACYLTRPLITNLSHSVYGGPGDPWGTIGFYGELIKYHYNPFLPGTISQLAAPEGMPIPWPRDIASAPGVLFMYLLALTFGPISAFGLYTLAGYTLTGVVTFLFARRLTNNTWASLIAGWAFAFYPFAALNGQGHLDHIHGWVLVLGVWRMVELMWYPTRRNGVLAGLAVAFGMWWSPYFILFGGVAYLTVALTTLFIRWLDGSIRQTLMPQLIAALIVGVFLLFLGGLTVINTAGGIGARSHGLRELNDYGARPLEYLLPDAQSPLFGGATSGYLNSLRHGITPLENTLYVGVTIIALALVAFVTFLRRRLTPGVGRAVIALMLVVLVAAITSMPPEPKIFGSPVPLPSHFISLVTSTWRVYERFVMIVMLALSVLAAVGLEILTRKRTSRMKIAIMSLASIVIPLDLWAPQGGHVERIPKPGIYRTLARQPPGLTAEYPLAASSFNNYGDQYYQRFHGMPMINGYAEGSFGELRAFSLSNLADPSTAPRLAALGVRYVLVDATPPTWGWPESGKPGAGFRLIAHEPYADLYVVTARPTTDALASTGEGFVVAELSKSGSVTALEKPTGEIEVTGTCTSCNGILSITLVSYGGQRREVTISGADGHTIAHVAVAEATPIKIPLRFTRTTILKVTTNPGPQLISPAPESPSVSILAVNPQFADLARAGVRAANGSGKQ